MKYNIYDNSTGRTDATNYETLPMIIQAISTNLFATIYNGTEYIKMILDKHQNRTMNEICKMIKDIPAFYSQLAISEVNMMVLSLKDDAGTVKNNAQFVYDNSDFDMINLINILNKQHLTSFNKMIVVPDDDKQTIIKHTLQNNMAELSGVCSKLDKENKYKGWQLRTKEIDSMTKDAEYSESDAYIQINGDIVSSKSQFGVYNEYMNNLDAIIRLIIENKNMFSLLNLGTDKNKQIVLKDLYPYM